ncbi:hypothetical protein MRX96_040828 [Rhipicephalus microplus]
MPRETSRANHGFGGEGGGQGSTRIDQEGPREAVNEWRLLLARVLCRAAGWAHRRRPCAADHLDRGPHAARSAGTPGRGSGADASPPTAASCGATSPAGRALLRPKGYGTR